MTVAELIEELRNLDQSLTIWHHDREEGFLPVSDIAVEVHEVWDPTADVDSPCSEQTIVWLR